MRRSIDTRLHITDEQHVGGSVFTDGGRLGSKYHYRTPHWQSSEKRTHLRCNWLNIFSVVCTFLNDKLHVAMAKNQSESPEDSPKLSEQFLGVRFEVIHLFRKASGKMEGLNHFRPVIERESCWCKKSLVNWILKSHRPSTCACERGIIVTGTFFVQS